MFNAALALGVSVSAIASYADTLMLCVSKAIGGPVGSLVSGPHEFMDRARQARQPLGGDMRQAGVLAAAALIGLDDGPAQIRQDHRLARRLAAGLRREPHLTLIARR